MANLNTISMTYYEPNEAPLDCSVQHIDLWLTHYQALDDACLVSAMHALLNDAERAHIPPLTSADDRLRYVATRAMVRTVLSRYATVAPDAWSFDRNAHGRPGIAARHGVPALRFNLSHTHGLIALAVGSERELGVDVENLARRQAPLGVAQRCFAPSEVADLAGLPQADQQLRFFEYWTLKESYIKARGLGLSVPLNRFSVHLPAAGPVSLSIDPGLEDDPKRWRFWQCRPTPDHLLALCADGPGARITVRTTVPTVSETVVETTWLRP